MIIKPLDKAERTAAIKYLSGMASVREGIAKDTLETAAEALRRGYHLKDRTRKERIGGKGRVRNI